MKISIIGSGWLAKPLARQLQQQGHDLLLTTTNHEKIEKLSSAGFKAITYELGDQLSNPTQLFDSDVVIIAITSKDTAAFDILMDQISEHNCRNLIFISSTSVYSNNGQSHDENSTSLNADNPLLFVEQLIQQHPKATIIRFAGLVGPGRHPGRFFKPGKTISTPSAAVNLIHLDDCIGIITTVIEKKAWGEVFNGCADTHPEKGVFYSVMAERLKLPPPKLGESLTTTSNKIILNKKVKNALGFQLKYPDVMNMSF